jgi:hypothetical protein
VINPTNDDMDLSDDDIDIDESEVQKIRLEKALEL